MLNSARVMVTVRSVPFSVKRMLRVTPTWLGPSASDTAADPPCANRVVTGTRFSGVVPMARISAPRSKPAAKAGPVSNTSRI